MVNFLEYGFSPEIVIVAVYSVGGVASGNMTFTSLKPVSRVNEVSGIPGIRIVPLTGSPR